MPDVPTAIPAVRNMTVHLWTKTVDLYLPKIEFIVKQLTSQFMYKKFFMISGVFYDSMSIFEIYCHLRQFNNTRTRIAFHSHLLSLDIFFNLFSRVMSINGKFTFPFLLELI